METEFELQGADLLIHLPAELDHPASDRIRRESDRLMRKQFVRTIIFDFAKTIFMDSSGIGLIMGRYRALGMRKGSICAVQVSEHIEKLLHLAGVHKYMDISSNQKVEG